MLVRTAMPLVLLIAVTESVGTAHAEPTATQRCQAALEVASARYVQCRLGAEARFALRGDAQRRDASLVQCAGRLDGAFAKATRKFGEASCSSVAAAALDVHLTRCSDDVVAVAALGGTLPPRVGLLATGQVTCWDESGAQIACVGTGQDGELRRGVTPAYVDNGDGTISDLITGLVWEKHSRNDGSIHDRTRTFTWSEAFSVKIAALNEGSGFAGHTDWRLPNRRELESILDLEREEYPLVPPAFVANCRPSTLPCTVLECSCTATNTLWTSTTARLQSQEYLAWSLFFYNGTASMNAKTSRFGVRAVRGG